MPKLFVFKPLCPLAFAPLDVELCQSSYNWGEDWVLLVCRDTLALVCLYQWSLFTLCICVCVYVCTFAALMGLSFSTSWNREHMNKLLRLGKYDFQYDKERGEREVKGNVSTQKEGK